MMTKLDAQKYSQDALNLDDQILVCAIVDANGEMLNMSWKSEKAPWEENDADALKFKEIQNKIGIWMKIIMGFAREISPIVGAHEYGLFVHKKYKLMILGAHLKEISVGLLLKRSVDSEYISNRVLELFG